MAEQKPHLPHKLMLDERKHLTMTGVTEVVSFDDTAVVLRLDCGLLAVQGQQLQLKNLSQDGGQITVDGVVSALLYEEGRPKGGMWRRLLG